MPGRSAGLFDVSSGAGTLLGPTITGVAMPLTVQVTPKYIYSGDGTGKIYQLDKTGKGLGWAQTGLGMGQTGCIIHELYAVSDDVLIKGSCSEWNVERITIKGAGRQTQ